MCQTVSSSCQNSEMDQGTASKKEVSFPELNFTIVETDQWSLFHSQNGWLLKINLKRWGPLDQLFESNENTLAKFSSLSESWY